MGKEDIMRKIKLLIAILVIVVAGCSKIGPTESNEPSQSWNNQKIEDTTVCPVDTAGLTSIFWVEMGDTLVLVFDTTENAAEDEIDFELVVVPPEGCPVEYLLRVCRPRINESGRGLSISATVPLGCEAYLQDMADSLLYAVRFSTALPEKDYAALIEETAEDTLIVQAWIEGNKFMESYEFEGIVCELFFDLFWDIARVAPSSGTLPPGDGDETVGYMRKYAEQRLEECDGFANLGIHTNVHGQFLVKACNNRDFIAWITTWFGPPEDQLAGDMLEVFGSWQPLTCTYDGTENLICSGYDIGYERCVLFKIFGAW